MSASRLILILRDQLDRSAALLNDADPENDRVIMTEAPYGQRRFPPHKSRLALCLAAMRHFRDDLRANGFSVHYEPAGDCATDVSSFLHKQIEEHAPDQVALTEPGNYALLQDLQAAADEAGVPLDVYPDTHFLCTKDDFDAWADGRKSPTMEYFYREQRRAYDVLLTEEDEPVGGDWNFDEENRESFGKDGPGLIPEPVRFSLTSITEEVFDLVDEHFPEAYGALDSFNWPVTPAQAEQALDDFIEHRLPSFGAYQDAMWTDRPTLYHSRLSAALNLRLLDPLDAVRRAESAYHDGHAPINAVEGFIRQILGWREFIRGIYWRHAADWSEMNALDAQADLPDFYWTADTEMTCMRQCLQQVVDEGHGHHIQRLMVTGLFGMLYGVDPQQMNDWHLAMYVDAWDWVSTPNMIGMSQYADGGIVGTKPYAASGKYINRMSNYCTHCRYDPDQATGDDACPFTTFYWAFLDENRDTLSDNYRMNFQMANLRRKDDDTLASIRERAEALRERMSTDGTDS